MSDEAIPLLRNWHAALNERAGDRLVASCTPDVRIEGPRGAVTGRNVLRDWMVHSGIRLAPTAIYRGASRYFVEEDASWPNHPETPSDEVVPACTAFEITGGLIAAMRRSETLSEAADGEAVAEVWRA